MANGYKLQDLNQLPVRNFAPFRRHMFERQIMKNDLMLLPRYLGSYRKEIVGRRIAAEPAPEFLGNANLATLATAGAKAEPSGCCRCDNL